MREDISWSSMRRSTFPRPIMFGYIYFIYLILASTFYRSLLLRSPILRRVQNYWKRRPRE